MTIIDDTEEHALTKQQYYRHEQELEESLEERKIFLTENEKNTVLELNKAAYLKCIVALIKRHRTEFETLLHTARVEADIDHLVESKYLDLIEKVKI